MTDIASNERLIFAGSLIFFLTITLIIARRKRRALAKWHNILIENAGDAVVILTPEGKLTYVSPSVKKVLGYNAAEVMQMGLLSLACPDDIAELQKVMAQVMASPGVPIKGHTGRMRHKDGTWHWYEAVVTSMLHDPAIGGIVDNFRDVTDRVQAEEKMSNANRLYAFISQVNQALVRAEDEQTVFQEACRAAFEYGKFRMAWIGLLAADRTISLAESAGISAADQLLFRDAAYTDDGPLAQVLRTGDPFICNNVARELELPQWQAFAAARELRSLMILPLKKNGEIVGAFSLYAGQAGLFDANEIRLLEEVAGDISFAMTVFEKETRRQHAEQQLLHSKSRLTEAQAIAHVGSWEIDFSTGIACWSDEACRIYGLPAGDNEHTQADWLAFIHPEDRERVLETTAAAAAALQSATFYHRIIRRDGTVRFIYSKTEFDFRDGRPVGLHGITQDLTELREMETARAQSDANLLMIMDLIPQAIFVKNFEGKYQFVNKSFAALYGLTPQQLLDKSATEEITVKAEKDSFLRQDQEVITTGQTRVIPELTFTDPAGNVRVFYAIKVPYTIAGKNEKAVLGIALDITEQRAVNASLVQRNKDLEQFSYIISHNLRGPVANILGLTEMLQTEGLGGEDETALLQGIGFSVKKLDRVIADLNHILEFRNTAGQPREWVSFDELLAGIDTTGSQLYSDFSAAPGMNAVRSYLYSIFYNLVQNSIKYCREDVPPEISISSSANPLRLQFKDNGLGIDLEKKGDELFGLYKRFHFHVEGQGMGLYLVKTQTEALGGKITVESEVNKGTTFMIEFTR
jgi:PAS domain S-box-containing protein